MSEKAYIVAASTAEEIYRAILAAPPGVDRAQLLETALASREERGRRRGVEEAAKFVEQSDECMHGECFVEGIRALAPRDSGTKHKDWCALFDNPEAGKSCDCHGDRK